MQMPGHGPNMGGMPQGGPMQGSYIPSNMPGMLHGMPMMGKQPSCIHRNALKSVECTCIHTALWTPGHPFAPVHGDEAGMYGTLGYI